MGALSVLRERVPTLSFHKSHIEVPVKIYVLQKRGDLEVKGGVGGGFEDLAERFQTERTSLIQRRMSADPTMRMNMRVRKTCGNQSQDRNRERKKSG